MTDQDTVYAIDAFSGCSKNSDSLIFNVLASPSTTLTSSAIGDTICNQTNVDFTASGATNYEFFVNGTSQGPASATNTFSTNSLSNGQIVTVTGESNTCLVSQSITMSVLPIPSVNLFSSDADNIICQGDAITFTAANASQYELFINGLSQGAPQVSPTFTPSVPTGSNEVYIIGTAANGCSDTSQTVLTVTVNPIPTITLTSSDADDIICANESVTFTGN